MMVSLAACSKDPEAAKRDYLASGDRYVGQSKLREAVIEYLNAIQVDGRYGEARFKLGNVYERLEETSNALREFVRAADLLPEREDVQMKAADSLLKSGGFEDAKRVASGVLKQNGRNLDAQLIMANALAGLKDTAGAIREFEAAIALEPRRIATYLNLAGYYSLNGRATEALAVLGRAVEIDPASVEVKVGMAVALKSSGELAKAEAILRKVLATKPADVMANRILADLYQQSGRARDAERPLRFVADATRTGTDRLSLAEYYVKSNRRPEAIPLLTELTSVVETRVAATLLLAQADHAEGRRDQAHKRVDDLLLSNPNDTRVLLFKAQLLSSDGRLDEALTRARSAASANPRLTAPQYTIGLIHLQRRDSVQALEAFNEVLKLDPGSADAALQVARLQLGAGRAELALKSIQGVVRSQPDNIEARITLVRALAAHGDGARADREAGALLTMAPSSADALVLSGSIAAARKNYAAARAAFVRALEIDPGSVQALAGVVSLELASGKPAEAQAWIDKRMTVDANNTSVLELAGRTYTTLGNLKKAEESWRKLIQVQPANLGAYAELGRLFYTNGRLEEARREFEQYAERAPSSIAAHTMIGVLLLAQNRIDEAQKTFERTLEISPDAPVAANNLAWLYAERGGNLDVALQLAQTAKRQLPDFPEIDDTLGWIYYKKGLASLAVSSFQQSAAKDPNNAGYHYRLGLALLKMGDTVKARASLERALKVDGGFKDAAEARRILATLG